MYSERREHARHNITDDFTVVVSPCGKYTPMHAFDCNISNSGIKITTSQFINRKSIKVQIFGDNFKTRWLPASILRAVETADGYEYGAMFEPLIDTEEQDLLKLIDRLTGKGLVLVGGHKTDDEEYEWEED